MDSGFRSPMKRRRDSGDDGVGGISVSEVAVVVGAVGARLSSLEYARSANYQSVCGAYDLIQLQL